MKGNTLILVCLWLACSFFLWMFFAAESLEIAADGGLLKAPAGVDQRGLAYRFAARWRHGMAGNSPLYMPGFFAVAVFSWLWAGGKPLRAFLKEGVFLLSCGIMTAKLLSSRGSLLILESFERTSGFPYEGPIPPGTLLGMLLGVYTLVTWGVGIISIQFALRKRSVKPLGATLALYAILALVRPWTVGDFTAFWIQETGRGNPHAVFSLLLIPSLAVGLALLGPDLSKKGSERSAERDPDHQTEVYGSQG